MSSIVVSRDATTAYSVGLKAAFVTASTADQNNKRNAAQVQHSVPVKSEDIMNAGQVYIWGEDNLKPQHIIKDARKNPIIPSTLSWKAELLYGGGLEFGYEEIRGDKKVLIPADKKKYPQIDAFRRSRGMRRYLRQASKAYYWWKFVAPELILSLDRKQIVSLASQRPEYCRFKKEENSPKIKNLVLSANWENGEVDLKDEHTAIVPIIDAYHNPVEWLREQAGSRPKGFKYIYPVIDHSPGTVYYPEAEWHAVRESGWLKVVEAIPQFKRALFENQITVKYLIEVSTWWWNWKYPGFDQFPTDKKKNLMSEELDNFTKFMTGNDNAGKAMMVSFQSNPQFQKEYPGWKITAIDNKIKDGIYIEDSQEANSHIMYALAVDPVLRGFTPGGKLTSGGSEKRVAWNNHIMMTKPHQDDILEVVHFIHEYNGWASPRWDPNIIYWFGNYYQATMDVAREPQQMAN